MVVCSLAVLKLLLVQSSQSSCGHPPSDRIGKTVINALRHNEGFVFLPAGTLQRDNALCGAHYIVHAQFAVDGQQQRIVLVAVNCAISRMYSS